MIALILASIVVGSIALTAAGGRGAPKSQPVRVETRDRKDRKRR